jgi:hypothetical protein
MKTTNQKIIKLKTGEIPIGDVTDVFVDKENPCMAKFICKSLDREIKVHSISLYKWFNDFESTNLEELKEAVFDGACNSLTGHQVEPDGWDEFGFPCKLMAAGMC